MIKIGVLGVGHLGKIHLQCLGQLHGRFLLTGFYDPDAGRAGEVEREFGLRRFGSVEELLAAVEAVDIVTPTVTHYELARTALEQGKHLFIEKPVTHTLEEARALIRLRDERKAIVQVGHVERFNPALLSLEGVSLEPMFIEGHRLAMFNPRGTDVSVVHDLMIHDLDILLKIVSSEVAQVSASGVAVVSETPDICNARIEFANGCVANLTASRISLKQMRKMRLFQRDAYISLDFLDKQAQIVRLVDPAGPAHPSGAPLMELPTARGPRQLYVEMPRIEPVNAIKMELETFAESIAAGRPPEVTLEDGYRALHVAEWISREIERLQDVRRL